MLRRCLAPAVLGAALLVTGCDGDMSEPLGDRDVAALLEGRGVSGQYPAHSLPGLLQAALRSVYVEHGAGAARALVTDLRRAHEQARSAQTSGGDMAAAAQAATRAEELEIVLRVFGDRIVATAMAAVRSDLQRFEQDLQAEAGAAENVVRARELMAGARLGLAEAEEAVRTGDVRGALDYTVQAGAFAERARRVRLEAMRVAGLPELFDESVARMRSLNGDGTAVRSRLVAYDELQRTAEAVVRTGDRQRAHAALKAARDEQIRIVLEMLGPAAVSGVLADAAAGLSELDAELRTARRAGRDVSQLSRMATTARDLIARGHAAAAAEDPATALDLGSHAAGLVNTLRLSLTR
jgi:hypothetical protein